MSQSRMMGLCELEEVHSKMFYFKLKETSYTAVDNFAQQIEYLQLQHKWYNTVHLALLLDTHTAVELPMRYVFEVLNDYNRSYEGLVAPALSLAVYHHPETEIPDVFHMFASLLEPPVKVKYFTNLLEAQEWLA